MNIYGELARIQKDLNAPKNLHNNFGNYNYRNAEGILEALKPLMNGLALVINDEPVLIGSRFYIKATVTITNGEESVSATAYAREDEIKKGMDGCQLTGACSSYARKYALNALFMIDDSKDSDSDELSPKNPANQTITMPTPQQILKHAGQVIKPAPVVTTVQQVPQIQTQQVPEQKEPDPVAVFISNANKLLREQRGISSSENNKLFREQFKALIAKGLTPNKKIEEYTMDEAVDLITMMKQRFDLTGTVVKE